MCHRQRCPVCNEQVSPEDLTTCRFQMTKALREDQRLTFVLVHREASSICVRASASDAMAVSPPNTGSELDGNEEEFNKLPCESVAGWHFSRVVRFMPGEHHASVIREIEALRLYRPAAIRAGDTELLPSIDAAVSVLEQQLPEGALARAAGQPAASSHSVPSWGCRYVDIATGTSLASGAAASSALGEELQYDELDEEDELNQMSPVQGEDASPTASPVHGALPSPALAAASSPCTADAGSSPALAPLPEPRQPVAERPGTFSRSAARIISLYQAEDGRLVFLQPFFTKLLLHEHGGRWDRLPSALAELRLEHLHELTVTEEVRKRYRFLAHLPLGSPAWFAEVDLKGHLSKETKECFADEFAKRRQQRLKEKAKDRRQERHGKLMAAVEEEQYYAALNLTHPTLITAPPTREDFAVDLQGRCVEDLGEAAAAEGEGAEGDADGPTLADKLKEKMTRKGPARRLRQEFKAEENAAFFPALGGGTSGAPARSSAAREQVEVPAAQPARSSNLSSTSAWGTGKGSDLARPLRSGADGQASAEGDGGSAQQPCAEEEPTLGQALEAALLRSTYQQAPEGAAEAELEAAATASTGKKKKKGKATTIRLFG